MILKCKYRHDTFESIETIWYIWTWHLNLTFELRLWRFEDFYVSICDPWKKPCASTWRPDRRWLRQLSAVSKGPFIPALLAHTGQTGHCLITTNCDFLKRVSNHLFWGHFLHWVYSNIFKYRFFGEQEGVAADCGDKDLILILKYEYLANDKKPFESGRGRDRIETDSGIRQGSRWRR